MFLLIVAWDIGCSSDVRYRVRTRLQRGSDIAMLVWTQGFMVVVSQQ